MKTSTPFGHPRLPLVIEPDSDVVADPPSITAWVKENRGRVDEALSRHGALLFRGYGIDTPESFERLARTVSSTFTSEYAGNAKRQVVKGSVYTASDLASSLEIPLHCEMSYRPHPPARVLFCCVQEPEGGGQTPIADMAEVYQELDPEVRDPLVENGITIVEVMPGPPRKSELKTWPELFESEDRQEVERRCREEGIEFEWLGDRGLKTSYREPVRIIHPGSGMPVWFTQFHLYHPGHDWEPKRGPRARLRNVAATLVRPWKRSTRPSRNRGRNACRGDGAAIPDRHLHHIESVLARHEVLFDWQKGDVLLLDNLRVAHGRKPFRGPRQIMAILAEPVESLA